MTKFASFTECYKRMLNFTDWDEYRAFFPMDDGFLRKAIKDESEIKIVTPENIKFIK